MTVIKRLSRREFMSLTGRAGGAFAIASSFPLLAMADGQTPDAA